MKDFFVRRWRWVALFGVFIATAALNPKAVGNFGGYLVFAGILWLIARPFRPLWRRWIGTPNCKLPGAGPVDASVLPAGERIVFQSPARFEVYSGAQAKVRGGFILFGSPMQLVGSLLTGFFIKKYIEHKASRRQWRSDGAGYVAVATEHLVISQPDGQHEFPYQVLKRYARGQGGVVFELTSGDKFNIRAKDRGAFIRCLDDAANGKLWRPLTQQDLASRKPVLWREERGRTFDFGVPAGWQPITDLQSWQGTLRAPITAGVQGPPAMTLGPAMLVIADGTSADSRETEAAAWLLPQQYCSGRPGAQVVETPRRVRIGKESGILFSVRYPVNGNGHGRFMARDTVVVVPHWGTGYRITYLSDETIHERYRQDFETMLANWRWSK